MIFFTVTNTRRKRNVLLKLALVLIMVAFALPYLHSVMLEAGAMHDLQAAEEGALSAQAEISEEEFPGEPVRVDGQLWLPLAHWQEVATLLSY